MQRCCSPHDEGVLAVSSTSSGRQLRKRAEAVRRYRQLMTNSRTQMRGGDNWQRCNGHLHSLFTLNADAAAVCHGRGSSAACQSGRRTEGVGIGGAYQGPGGLRPYRISTDWQHSIAGTFSKVVLRPLKRNCKIARYQYFQIHFYASGFQNTVSEGVLPSSKHFDLCLDLSIDCV